MKTIQIIIRMLNAIRAVLIARVDFAESCGGKFATFSGCGRSVTIGYSPDAGFEIYG